MDIKTTIDEILELQPRVVKLRHQLNQVKDTLNEVVTQAADTYMAILRLDLAVAREITLARELNESLPKSAVEWPNKDSFSWILLDPTTIELVIEYDLCEEITFFMPVSYITDPEALDRLRADVNARILERKREADQAQLKTAKNERACKLAEFNSLAQELGIELPALSAI